MSKIKEVYVSRYEGGQLAQFDLSQIEIVVLAFLSKSPSMIKDIENGIDFHLKRLAYVTREDYNVLAQKYSLGNKDVIEARKKIKEVSFQRSYGASVKSVSKSTGLSIKEVVDIFDIEEALYPEVNAYYGRLISELSTNIHVIDGKAYGVLKSYSGKEYAFERLENTVGRIHYFSKPKVLNYPVQGLAAEIIKVILQQFYLYLHDDFVLNSIKIINTTHDDVLFDCRDEKVVTKILVPASLKVLRIIPNLLSKYLGVEYNVRIRGTLSYGPNWGSLTHHVNLEN